MSNLTKPQQLWVDALRSGEYKQGKGALQSGDSFCCLGVACIVAEKHGVPVEKVHGRVLGSHLSLQVGVQRWLGLSDCTGIYSKGTSLAGLNDTGVPFSEIADIIESKPEGLFVE